MKSIYETVMEEIGRRRAIADSATLRALRDAVAGLEHVWLHHAAHDENLYEAQRQAWAEGDKAEERRIGALMGQHREPMNVTTTALHAVANALGVGLGRPRKEQQ